MTIIIQVAVNIINFPKIEKKWQKKWEKKKIFEAHTGRGKKFFLTFPYPYVNGAPHIGHSYSALRVDALARFKRMQGFNVLFPQGFHATGEPILGVVERLRNNDAKQIETMRQFGATEHNIRRFMKDPKFVAIFWMKRWIRDMKRSGFSIDWRRSFITALTPEYSRFIEWQYKLLKKKGYVVQGTHPVIWCPRDESPTGDHDRLEGEGESPVEYILLKFRMGNYILPAATLRPETIFGVTNIWLNPETEYTIIKNGTEKWIVSNLAVRKLKDQLHDIDIIEKVKLEELFGKHCTNPITNTKVPILPASFVNPDSATGIVMSVPSHAPYDWIALKELEQNVLHKYDIHSGELNPISLITMYEFNEHPAIELCKAMGIHSLKDKDKLDMATRTLYKKEFHLGKLKENCGKYSGFTVKEAKEVLVMDFIKDNTAVIMWDCNAICRCTTRCHVKILENQWFLKFSDEKWKNLAKKAVAKMYFYPNEVRTNMLNTIDWLKDKACARRSGLGTTLPWDSDWIVETLSDSTIYMAYYTIAHIIKQKKMHTKQLTDDVFNFIFLNKGEIKSIAKQSKIGKKTLQEMQNEFSYFYPVDFRNSGKDLIQNHLTFYVFHHVAIFPASRWPRGIGVNGHVKIEGEKMSKSKGNMYPLHDLMKMYGADLTRINIIAASEGIDDANWKGENIKGYQTRYEFLSDIVKNIRKAHHKRIRSIDSYILSRTTTIVKEVYDLYETTRFRSGVHFALFESTNMLKWYIKRVGGIRKSNKKILTAVLADVLKILSPITPHICEELWHKLRKKKMISAEEWPEYNPKFVNENVEISEEMIKTVLEDIEDIKNLTKIRKPKKISLYVAEKWKFDIYKMIFLNKDRDINEITKKIMSGPMRVYGSATLRFIDILYKKINELKPVVPRNMQMKLLKEAKKFLEKETGAQIFIIDATRSEVQKAKISAPQKLGILLED